MEKSRRENINSRFAIDISCFETPLDIVSAVFGRCGQMLGVLEMMASTIARLYEPTPESPASKTVPATPIPPSWSACSVLAMSVGTYILMYRAWVTLSSCALTMPTDSPRPTARPRRHLR